MAHTLPIKLMQKHDTKLNLLLRQSALNSYLYTQNPNNDYSNSCEYYDNDNHNFNTKQSLSTKQIKQYNIDLTRRLSKRDSITNNFIMKPNEVISIIKKTKAKNIPIDLQTYTSAIQICNAYDQYELGIALFEPLLENSMRKELKINKDDNSEEKHDHNEKIQFDRVCFGTAMTSYMYINNLHKVEELYQIYQKIFSIGSSKQHNKEDMVILSLMMATLDNNGQWDSILKVYYAMNHYYGLKPGPKKINNIIRSYMKLKKWNDLDTFINQYIAFPSVYPSKAVSSPLPITISTPVSTYQPEIKNATTYKSLGDMYELLKKVKREEEVGFVIANVDIYNSTSLLTSSIYNNNDSINDILVNNNRDSHKIIIIKSIDLLKSKVDNKYLINNSKLRRRMNRLIDKLIEYNTTYDDNMNNPFSIFNHDKVLPSSTIYQSLIQSAGLRHNLSLAFEYFNYTVYYFNFTRLVEPLPPDRLMIRTLIEACAYENNNDMKSTKNIIMNKIKNIYSNYNKNSNNDNNSFTIIDVDMEKSDPNFNTNHRKFFIPPMKDPPMAIFWLGNQSYNVTNKISKYTKMTQQMIRKVSFNSSFKLDINTLPEHGINLKDKRLAEFILLNHCEKQALAAILHYKKSIRLSMEINLMDHSKLNSSAKITDSVFPEDNIINDSIPIYVQVNLCMCDNCHAFFKVASLTYNCKLQCKDPSTLHMFENGVCSCNEHWGGR
eukprot:gene10992-14766_t